MDNGQRLSLYRRRRLLVAAGFFVMAVATWPYALTAEWWSQSPTRTWVSLALFLSVYAGVLIFDVSMLRCVHCKRWLNTSPWWVTQTHWLRFPDYCPHCSGPILAPLAKKEIQAVPHPLSAETIAQCQLESRMYLGGFVISAGAIILCEVMWRMGKPLNIGVPVSVLLVMMCAAFLLLYGRGRSQCPECGGGLPTRPVAGDTSCQRCRADLSPIRANVFEPILIFILLLVIYVLSRSIHFP